MRKFLFVLFFAIPALMLNAADKYRILVGCPIRQNPAILMEFLASLNELDQSLFTLDYFFIDDNVDESSREILQKFQKQHDPRCMVIRADDESLKDSYVLHQWKPSIVWKVAGFKDRMIERARKEKYDYLFFIDSDLVLHPNTVNQLIQTQKDIVSNIFWTNWTPEGLFLPQVWMQDHYDQFERQEGEQLSNEELQQRMLAFLAKMRIPGTYEVGGLGACTLISKNALAKEISFKKIKNISFWGEDRHFCIRANALGLDLFVDTHYPAFHIYREPYLAFVEGYKRHCRTAKDPLKPRLTLSMVIQNDAERYLKKVLEEAKQYITDAVIIDNGSADKSGDLCREILAGIPLALIRNEEPLKSEIDLRKQQWQEIAKTSPEWILFLNADEIFESRFKNEVAAMMAQARVDVYYFRSYDFWDETHYRDDKNWHAHQFYQPFLLRYRPDVPMEWNNPNAGILRLPDTCLKLLGCQYDLALKNYGWSTPQERMARYFIFKEMNPQAGEICESILDPNPTLVKFERE